MSWIWDDSDPRDHIGRAVRDAMLVAGWSPARIHREVDRAIQEWDDSPEAGPVPLTDLVRDV